MDNAKLARWWLQLVGVILVVVGVLGFFPNPLVGPNGLVATDNIHNIVHVLTGALALAFVYVLKWDVAQSNLVFGALYAVVFVATIVSPTLFGIFSVPVNAIDHLIHIGIAVVSLGLGWMARGRMALGAR